MNICASDQRRAVSKGWHTVGRHTDEPQGEWNELLQDKDDYSKAIEDQALNFEKAKAELAPKDPSVD